MTSKVFESKKLTTAIDSCLHLHPTSQVLIHAVSYRLQEAILDLSSFTSQMAYAPNSKFMASAISDFKQKQKRILLSPSVQRGIDLPNDLCDVIIIAKVPYPSLGDKRIAARTYMKGGDIYYSIQTVRSLVQIGLNLLAHRDPPRHAEVTF